tara:strand:+ start:163 stop:405 length:243 start_codon:yes stop_codon:yes gene_type:complete
MNNLINEFNEIIRWPKKPKEKQFVIKWLSEKFESEKQYSEKEINQIIKQHHSFNDIALLRRELVSQSFLNRKDDGSLYWR